MGEVFEVEGNRLALLVEGPERLEALMALIAEARESLRLLYYMFEPDRVGARVRDALIAALGRGVSVSLVVDGFGSSASDGFFLPLKDAGARVCRFVPRWGRRYLLRNHQKMAIADGARAIVGGFNIADDYFAARPGHEWRDLGLAIDGPEIPTLCGYFDALADWARRPGATMRGLRRALDRWSETRGRTRWLLGGPARRLSPWVRAMKHDLSRCRQLDMITAYFAPNPAMLRRIEKICDRGGQARIVTAAKSDNGATVGAARHCYARLLRHGVSVWEYQPVKLHTKLFVVDDIVHLGSANFDMRSLYLNLEIMLRIKDKAFADHVRAYVEGELGFSQEITREAHARANGWFNRLRWGIAYFMVAVLDYGVARRLNFGIEG
ncbi:phospholipase D-like domain-containing protein [Flavisphingomonas formosensis]|uniref:phospholipase D-like domain-containing protein n=1 Tax=Flavisphingomonas formosensis TaxID=861534 RepID=UPI001E4666DF|nr:phosphatidylserine/phosphatidylglycerophosphate/cardiolipin synthase family protein [Sphingomonas formosensis]